MQKSHARRSLPIWPARLRARRFPAGRLGVPARGMAPASRRAGSQLAQRAGEQAAAQFGDPTLQSYLQPLRANLSSFAGVQFASLSAHQALHYMSIVLLVLAALALLDALFPLVRTDAVPEGAGGALALLGAVAAACVLYRMVERPAPAGPYIALSLREGAWLALLGSLAMLAGGLWPRLVPVAAARPRARRARSPGCRAGRPSASAATARRRPGKSRGARAAPR